MDPYKLSYNIEGKRFLPIYIGYNEAAMMKKEKLFTNNQDRITGLFGSDVLVAGVAKKNFTVLDEMHFVSKEFKENYFKLVQNQTKWSGTLQGQALQGGGDWCL